MQDLIIYLIKSAGLLCLFYAGYFFLLKNDTHFEQNRFFLLAGIFTSLFLPLLEITHTVPVESSSTPVFLENFSAGQIANSPVRSTKIDWWQIGGIIYLAGLGFFLLKFLFELFSLLKLIYSHKATKKGDHYYIKQTESLQPFSFFKYIVYNPAQHSPEELELILKHEQSHARQWHSIDQLLSSLCTYLLWFNPLAWLYRKGVVQNLEYLADKEVIAAQVSKREYQKTLLKICFDGLQPALTNQFYQSLIKKRILMINKKDSQKSTFWKTSLLLPFLLLFIFSFNVKTVAMAVPTLNQQQEPEVETSVYVTKDTQEKALRSYERLFEKQGVELKFSNLKYNAGLITNVVVSFRRKSNGTTGNLSLSNSKGIGSLLISVNENEVTMTPTASAPQDKEGSLSGIGNAPLYIIKGQEYKTAELIEKYLVLKGEWNFLKPQEAEKMYGSKAKDGAIIIAEANIIKSFKEALKEMDLKQRSFSQNYIQVKKDAPPVLLGVKTEVSEKTKSAFGNRKGERADGNFKLQKVQYHYEDDDIIAIETGNEKDQKVIFQETTPLVVIDGKVKDKDFNLEELVPSTMKSMNVLKGSQAVEKYGDQGKNGVLEIEMKSAEEIKAEKANKKKESFTLGSWRFEDEEKGNSSLTILGGKKDVSAHVPFRGLVVLNGKTMPDSFDPDSISTETIEKITVLKGPHGVEKYGEKAAKGVIEITTKK